MLSSGNKGFTMSSNVNSPVSPDAHCASSISDLRETHSHSDVSFGSMYFESDISSGRPAL